MALLQDEKQQYEEQHSKLVSETVQLEAVIEQSQVKEHEVIAVKALIEEKARLAEEKTQLKKKCKEEQKRLDEELEKMKRKKEEIMKEENTMALGKIDAEFD